METTLQGEELSLLKQETDALNNSFFYIKFDLCFFDFLPLCLLFDLSGWYVGMFEQGEQVRTGSQRLVPSFPCGPIPSPKFACLGIWLLY